ncbi:carbohydrate ABC transporter permease [Corynebacterium mendelii]|uniref:Carbohydrate ABC transporter permease n=1 Tax=Corynebacterium mendelii TaxID=2765362 RepID=A0A939E036_9CORY|nr:carbohydrate ABC transporter permease [Corynebacterium mendelii]MBN9644006.1 carbohydrate ABC transporter permease [Corynebacterium mendelii]
MARLGKTLLWAFIVFLIIISVLPFILMILVAFQKRETFGFDIADSGFTFDNFIELFQVQGFGNALLLSTSVVIIACVSNVVICSLAAYGFVFKKFVGSEVLFWIYLATMMVPAQVTVIANFVIFRKIGILGTTISLALPILNAFGVFLVRQFMVGIPPSLLEAARIDGATDWRIFRSVVLPLIRPVLTALTVFTFLSTWNDFMWPLVSLQSDTKQTVTLAISKLSGAFLTQYGLVMAGTTIAFVVPFLVYVFLQRQFVEGVAATGIKG